MPFDPDTIFVHSPEEAQAIRNATRIGGCLGLLVLFGVVVLATLTPYTEYLWYAHDARRPDVFSIGYETRGMLFLASLVVGWIVLYFSLRQALRLSLVYLRTPGNYGEALVGNAMTWVQAKGAVVVRFAAPVLAFLGALEFANEWNTLLLSQHAQAFGVKDPTFGFDLGFFVFQLPWYRAMANYAVALLTMTTLLTLGVYVGMQALAMLARIELSRPHIRFHVSLLLGVTALAYATQIWLKTYEVGLIDSGQFTGAGYAAMRAFSATRIFAGLLAVGGIATIFGQRIGRPYQVPIASAVTVGAFFLVAVVGYPAVVQKLFVDPNRLSAEAPYARQAIQMTRFAYGLDKIEVRDVDVRIEPTKAEVAGAQTTLDNMRLWDPDVLRSSLEGLQSIRPYYSFSDVDVDRYPVNGKQTMVMLSSRDLQIDGLDPAARNWTNERLRYTHGYGLDIAQVDEATPEGQPTFLAEDMPQRSTPDFPISQPRIYFSDTRDAYGNPDDDYVLVDTKVEEFDYPTAASSETHRWQGDRGIPIGGGLARLAYSIVLGDGNLLVSPDVTAQTRLLRHRSVIDRASRVYPFLRFDHDPYIVLIDGHMVWLLDGYTSTDMVPYSDRIEWPGGALNYMRNSVKVSVDAYTGETAAYAVDPQEPILRAYRRIYPGLVHDLADAPAELQKHFRYPEDLFRLQSAELSNYHVTDPTLFLSNGDAWDVARERGLSGETESIAPYFVQMQLPDEAKAGFLLILPFTPRGKPVMSGWLAAHCDPDDYGRLTEYRFSKGYPVGGPELLEGNFSSTPEISNINRNYNNEQSSIIVGNLLVIPVGRSVMYVEPLFLKSKTQGLQSVPRLFRVILALNDKVVVGENYHDALRQLFGAQEKVQPAAPTVSEGQPSKSSIPVPQQARQALELLDQADAALRAGDFAKYGSLQKRAKALLQQLVGK